MGFLLALLLVAGSAIGGAGAAPAAPRHPVTASGGTVAIAGHPVLRFRTSLGGVTPDQRADIVAFRLQDAVAHGLDPRAFSMRPQGKLALIYCGPTHLLTITPEEARAQRSEPKGLASLWVRRLRTLLSTPVLTASTRRVVIPLGETRAITFGGLLKAPDSVAGAGEVVAVDLQTAAARAVLTGRARGDAVLTFQREGVALPVEVAVRPYAGAIPEEAEGFVTGIPAPRDLVDRIARAAARKSLRLEPGGTAEVGNAWGEMALRPGHHIRVPVGVRVEAPDCLPRTGRVAVTITNLRLPPLGTPRLFYSNHPERVQGYGTLFLGRVAAGAPARLLYHHQNGLGRRFLFSVDLVNPAEEPVRLHVMEGEAPLATDPIVVGQQAARDFLRNQRAGVGYVISLAPRSVTSVVRHSLLPWQVASGLFGLRQLDGEGGCYVHVKVDDPESPFVRPPDGGQPLSSTIFDTAHRPVEASFTVGGRWAFVRLGSSQQPGASRLTEAGFGDYGVTYDIHLTLSNPTGQSERVGVVMEAASGQARGLMVVDGKVVETRTLDAHEEMVLALYTLPPGGARSVRIRTLPLSGSAYPVRLVARGLPPSASIRAGSVLRAH